MSNGEKIQGYLVVKVLEAADHNSDDVKVWDPNFTHGFVKSKLANVFIPSSVSNRSANHILPTYSLSFPSPS
jgi:hypothetical protein